MYEIVGLERKSDYSTLKDYSEFAVHASQDASLHCVTLAAQAVQFGVLSERRKYARMYCMTYRSESLPLIFDEIRTSQMN